MSTPSEIERAAANLVSGLAKALSEATAAVRPADQPDGRSLDERLFEMCGGVDDPTSADDSAQNDLAQERVDAIHAFVDLVRDHPMPRKLLPRGDQPGEDFTIGEEVIVIGGLHGTVVPPANVVAVNIAGNVVIYPRVYVKKAVD